MVILGLLLAEAMLANIVETTSKKFPAQGVEPANGGYGWVHRVGEPVMLGSSYWLCSCSLAQHCSL